MTSESCFSNGCSFFAYSWKLPAYSGAFFLTVDNLSFYTYNWSFLLTALAFLLTVGAFMLTVRLIRPLGTVSKEA